MKKLKVLALVLAGLFGATALLAQAIFLPNITSHLSGDLIQVIPSGQPSAQSQYEPWTGITNVYGYYKNGTGTGNVTLTTPANTTFVQFSNATAIANLYLYLPAAPFDGARACYFSVGGITAMTMWAGLTTDTLNNAITAISANTGYCYIYSKSNTSWDRS